MRVKGTLTRTAKKYLGGSSTKDTAHFESMVAVKNLLEMGNTPEIVSDIISNTRQLYLSEPKSQSDEKARLLVDWVVENWHG